MQTITLNNGIEMPLVGLGTNALHGQECIDTILEALNSGYRLIDTAQMYGNEEEVGKAIQQSGIHREDLFITTKLNGASNSYEKSKKAIEESLQTLHLDYIDLLLIHEPYSNDIQMYQAMKEAYAEGKVRAIGISNYGSHLYKHFIQHCGIIPAVNQVETHLHYQKWKLQQLMKIYGTQMQAWSPLTHGSIDLTKEPILVVIANKYHKTPAQVVLRFLTQRCISILPKTKHKQRLKENIDLFDFTLTNQEMKMIHSLDQSKTYFSWTKTMNGED